MAASLVIATLSTGLSSFAILSPRSRSTSAPLTKWFEKQLEVLASSSTVSWLDSNRAISAVSEKLQERAVELGLHVTPRVGVVLLALIGILSVLIGAVFSLSFIGALAALFAYCLGVSLIGRRLLRAREVEIVRDMPQLIRSLASAMASGQTLAQAISYVGDREEGRAASEFKRAALSIRCGTSVHDALEDISRSIEVPGTRLLISALEISQRTGSPLESLLLRSARMVESSVELERQLLVKTAQVRLSARVVCLMPVLMCVLLGLISPDFQQGIQTVQGLVSLGLALAMDGAAVVLIRHLMKGVLS